jgi:hypothetical protein
MGQKIRYSGKKRMNEYAMFVLIKEKIREFQCSGMELHHEKSLIPDILEEQIHGKKHRMKDVKRNTDNQSDRETVFLNKINHQPSPLK